MVRFRRYTTFACAALAPLAVVALGPEPFAASAAAPAVRGVTQVAPHSNIALAPAKISSVSITGSSGHYTVTITGTGFGQFPASLPMRGYSPYLLIQDAAQQSAGNWGYTSSGVVRSSSGTSLTYDSWTATRIVVSGLGATAGNALVVVVASPGPNANRRATWGGRAPGGSGGSPHINVVTFSGSGQNLEMTILGSAFGPAPTSLPYTGDTRYLRVQDWARPCGQSARLFSAGYRPWDGSTPDAVTLRILSWSVARIVVDGFGSAYGSTTCATGAGGYPDTIADDWPDAMSVTLWNTADPNARGGQTSWGGPDVRAVGIIDHPLGKGYWITASDGKVRGFGTSKTYGDLAGTHLGGAVAALGRTIDGRGYWLAEANGTVHGYGDASTSGAVHGNPVTGSVVDLVGSPVHGASSDSAFWMVTSTGAVQTRGSAGYFGSEAGHHLNKPIVAMAVMPDGKGYWLVASDGGIFSFGSAKFHGSTGSLHLKQPIDGMATTPDGKGYWLVASDGGVFCFGDSHFYGSLGEIVLNAAIVGMSSTPDGKGYWLAGADGGVFALGDARFYGAGI